jgi:MULE transposase domain
VAKTRLEELDGLTPTQALFVALEAYNIQDENLENRYTYWYHCNNEGRVDYLFFVHPKSRELLCKHPDVLLIDSTYSTNRYNMPLAHVTGRTSQNGSFDIGYAFMAAESTYLSSGEMI